jgi:hypothetical protein
VFTLKEIEDVLRRTDIEGLIESGAPDNEYESEAIEILRVFSQFTSQELTEDKMLEIICDVWTRSFGHDKHETDKIKDVFLHVVHELCR